MLYLLVLVLFNLRRFRPSIWLVAYRAPRALRLSLVPQLILSLLDVCYVNEGLLSPKENSALFLRSLPL